MLTYLLTWDALTYSKAYIRRYLYDSAGGANYTTYNWPVSRGYVKINNLFLRGEIWEIVVTWDCGAKHLL